MTRGWSSMEWVNPVMGMRFGHGRRARMKPSMTHEAAIWWRKGNSIIAIHFSQCYFHANNFLCFYFFSFFFNNGNSQGNIWNWREKTPSQCSRNNEIGKKKPKKSNSIANSRPALSQWQYNCAPSQSVLMSEIKLHILKNLNEA